MKYPAILKNTIGGQTVLAVSGKLFIHMSGEFEVEDSESYSFDSRYTNITAEYLSNTYGEVKSKEHAEFIVKLCQENNIPVIYSVKIHDAKSFQVSCGCLSLYSMSANELSVERQKQITIPLPPKEFLMEFEEREDEASKDDEWPKVGSRALVNNDNDYELDYGENLIGKEVEVINLFTDGDLKMAVVKHDIANYCFRIEMLSKPKTKEEKERDEIKEEIKEIFREAMKSPLWFIYDSDEQAANYLLERFDITKKPQ